MELEKFMEQNIIEFLNSEQEKQVQIKEIREDEVDLFDIDRDYVKDMQLELEKGRPEKARFIFDDLKKMYNSIPLTDPKKKKVFSIIKEAFGELKAYANKNTSEVSLIEEINNLERTGLMKGQMPERITTDSVFAHEVEVLLKDQPPEAEKTIIKEANIQTGSLRISDEFIKNMAREIRQDIPMEESAPATRILVVSTSDEKRARDDADRRTRGEEVTIEEEEPEVAEGGTSERRTIRRARSRVAGEPAERVVVQQADPGMTEIRTALTRIAEHLTNRNAEDAKEVIEDTKQKLKEVPSSGEKKELMEELKQAQQRIGALEKDGAERKNNLEKQRKLQSEINKVKQGISACLKDKNIKAAKSEFGKLRSILKEFPSGEERHDLFEDINLIHSEIKAFEDLMARSAQENEKVSQKIKEQELKEINELLKQEISSSVKQINERLSKDSIQDAIHEYKNLKSLYNKYQDDKSKLNLKKMIVKIFRKIEHRNEMLLQKRKAALNAKTKDLGQEEASEWRQLFEDIEKNIKQEDFRKANSAYEKARGWLSSMPESNMKKNLSDILDNLHNKIANIQSYSSRIADITVRKSHTQNLNMLYLTGLRELYNNRKAKAAEIFKEVLSRNPGHAAAKIRLKEALS